LTLRSRAPILALVFVGGLLRVLLVLRAPTPYGYVFDFYHEGIQKLYVLKRLPTAADCWQCYHPPLFFVVSLPFYALGKWIAGGPMGLADPALRFAGVVPVVSGLITAFYGYRILRRFAIRGPELVVGTGLIVAFPCLFISTYGLEADILLTALMTAFTYYAVTFCRVSRPPDDRAAARIGLVAGLACSTKYTGLLAPAVLLIFTAARTALRPGQRRRVLREAAVALSLCFLIGGWKYIDNYRTHGTALFANGSASQGLAFAGRHSYASEYDFFSLRIGDLLALATRRVPPGELTDLPFYRSVWTTLHGMAWSDMSFFSDPSRHGFRGKPYPRKRLDPTLTGAVLILGLVPDVLAIIGFLVTLRRRVLLPVAVICAMTFAAYALWFIAQESWALKTKYILFLLPAYVLYALLGARWLSRRIPIVDTPVWALLYLLVVGAHLYLLDFVLS